MRIITLFPNLRNVNLYKGLGKDVELLSKQFGHVCDIAHYYNDYLSYFKEKENNLGSRLIREKWGPRLDGVMWLLRHLYSYDLLRLYNLTASTILWILFAKIINHKVRIWVVLDYGHPNGKSKPFRRLLYMNILKIANLVTIESTEAMNVLESNYGVKSYYHPHCVYDLNLKTSDFKTKENIILTVGRIGDYSKNNELLIETFIDIYENIPDWELYIVGPYNDSFLPYLNKVKALYPNCPIVFTGEMNKIELANLYSRAKIFCLTSRNEGFPNVIVEAASLGCYIISSKIASIVDFTSDSNFGALFEVEDKFELQKLLIDKCNSIDLEKQAIEAYNHYIKIYACEAVISRLNNLLIDCCT